MNHPFMHALIYSLLTFMIVITFIFIIPLIPAGIRRLHDKEDQDGTTF